MTQKVKFYSMHYSRVKGRAAVRGWTVAELARRCGVSRQALEVSLKGEASTLDSIDRLVKALDVPGHKMTRERLFAPLTVAELLGVAGWYLGLSPVQVQKEGNGVR